jgi:L-glutamine-phosphate cytidylyltransferase
MRGIVLAAGKGERLMPLTADCPKSLVDLGGGQTLMQQQVTAMAASGHVDDICFIVGYRARQIEAAVAARPEWASMVRTLFNPFYGLSNNLASLWLAGSEMTSDFFVTNGDNLFAPSVFSRVLGDAEPGITLAISAKHRFDYDDMRVTIRGGEIVRIGKQLPDLESHAESPGLAIVKGPTARAEFRSALDHLVRNPQALQTYWLEVFNEVVEAGGRVRPWFFDGQAEWQEMDFHGDHDRIRLLLTTKVHLFLDAGRAEAAAPVAVS